MTASSYPSGFYLKTFGTPALLRDGEPIPKVRTKDLALLVFLRLECEKAHHRKDVADKLFRADADASQRLYNANGRLKNIAKHLILAPSFGMIKGNCALPCDAAELLAAHANGSYEGLALDRYTGGFLEGFDLTDGAEGFEYWKAGQWTKLRVAIEPIWRATLEHAVKHSDWLTVRSLGLELLEADPDSEEFRALILRAWLELGEYEIAEANYENYRLALARIDEEPAPVLEVIIRELRRKRTLRGTRQQSRATARPHQTSFSQLEIRDRPESVVPNVDVFLSAAMASTESPQQYDLERAHCMLIVEAVRDLGFTIHFAGEHRPSYDYFEDEGNALQEVVSQLRRSRLFILYYPRKRPSSSLIELGMAMAFGKRSTVLVNSRGDLPFLLVSPTRHFPPVEVFRYRDLNDVLKYLRGNLRGWVNAS